MKGVMRRSRAQWEEFRGGRGGAAWAGPRHTALWAGSERWAGSLGACVFQEFGESVAQLVAQKFRELTRGLASGHGRHKTLAGIVMSRGEAAPGRGSPETGGAARAGAPGPLHVQTQGVLRGEKDGSGLRPRPSASPFRAPRREGSWSRQARGGGESWAPVLGLWAAQTPQNPTCAATRRATLWPLCPQSLTAVDPTPVGTYPASAVAAAAKVGPSVARMWPSTGWWVGQGGLSYAHCSHGGGAQAQCPCHSPAPCAASL